jgi:hypothetical protein
MGSHWLDRSHRSRLIGIHMRIQQTSRHHAPRDLMPASVFRWYRHWSEVFATDHGVHQAARYGMTESQMMTLVSFDDPHVMVGEVARIQAIAPAYADPPSTTDAP